MSSAVKIWKSFCNSVVSKENNIHSNQLLFLTITEWLKKNTRYFKNDEYSIYGLDAMTNVNPHDYPSDFYEESISDTILRIKLFNPTKTDNIAMIIRNILWNIIVYKSSKLCPNCKDDELRVLYDSNIKSVVLACDLCTYTENKDGKKWKGKCILTPAKIEFIKEISESIKPNK